MAANKIASRRFVIDHLQQRSDLRRPSFQTEARRGVLYARRIIHAVRLKES
jgi:hypothetical protein